MDWPGRKITRATAESKALPRFPRIWIGYLLGVRDAVDAEMIALKLHPELAKEPLAHTSFGICFLANFISLIYWLVCVYEYHVVLAQATAGAYPIKPLRAAWFHLIPIYGLYWVSSGRGNWPAL